MSLKKVKDKDQKKKVVKYILLGSIVVTITALLFYLYNQNPNILKDLKDEFTDSNEEIQEQKIRGTTIEEIPPTRICLGESLDQALINKLKGEVVEAILLKNEFESEQCAIHLTRTPKDTNEYLSIWTKLYVPIVRYDDQLTDVSENEFVDGVDSQFMDTYGVIWSMKDSAFIESNFKESADMVFQHPKDVVNKVELEKGIIGIIPLQYLTPKVKIVTIDNVSPIDENLSIYRYILADMIWINNEFPEEDDYFTVASKKIRSQVAAWETENQYDPEAFKSLLLTGKSAVGARQYLEASKSDDSFNPLSPVHNLFEDATYAHISNNTSFSEACTWEEGADFLCGSIESFDWLVDGGVNIVSLTGSNILDYDRTQFYNTLDLYNDNGIVYFGGGRERKEAVKPAVLTIGESKISFLGYSLFTPTRYIATNRLGGNLAADLNYRGDAKTLTDGLDSIEADSNLTIVEMQWGDQEGTDISIAEKEYAQIAADNGADIIIGTTSDKIKKIEYLDDTLVFYGLGNFIYHNGSRRSNEGLIVELLFLKDVYIGYRLHPVFIEGNLEITLADVDKKAKILNTVY